MQLQRSNSSDTRAMASVNELKMLQSRRFKNSSIRLVVTSPNPVFPHCRATVLSYNNGHSKIKKNPTSYVLATVIVYDCAAIDASAVLQIGSPAVTSSGMKWKQLKCELQ